MASSPKIHAIGEFSDVRHDEIAKRAYELFQKRGCTHGHDCDDWFQAERELQAPATHTAAILIIGSLIWDERHHRECWRRERLVDGFAISVPAPIRYGRILNGRERTYTMVFSNGLLPARVGWALVVPCRHPVACADDLVHEAQALWSAEQSTLSTPDPISAGWGAVGLLCNPLRATLDEIKAGWIKRVSREQQHYRQFQHAEGETPAVDQDGMLTIPWPTTQSGESLKVDLLLATATQPSLQNGSYATAEAIAAAWKRAPRQLRYFDENRRAGITTAEDYSIMGYLCHETA
jgi:hypothetical protein